MEMQDVIDMGKSLFTKIECVSYDILVPFICKKTGGCCSVYLPVIPEKDLIEIVRDLQEDEAVLFDAYMSCFRKNMTSHPGPCLFLDQNNLCRIHDHPLRPAVCRLYPFSYGGASERCPSYREHKRLVTILTDRESSCQLYDASFCPNREVRPIPDRDWPQMLASFRQGRSFPEMEKTFIQWNRQAGALHGTKAPGFRGR